MQIIAKNKKAFFDYEILKKYIAGIALLGSEIKSIREKNVVLKGSFVTSRDGEVFWKGAFIKHWRYDNSQKVDEYRDRKLLLHKKQILEMEKAQNEQGVTIVPLALGFERGRAKLEIALARGKKKYDKRETIKKRDLDRQMKQKMKYS